MTHKDAPPETPDQTACRLWWTNAQPHVTRAWGRAKDGSFFAEESKLLHQAWLAARPSHAAALVLYEQAFDQLITHACSNGLYTGWGTQLDCTLLNKAYLQAGHTEVIRHD